MDGAHIHLLLTHFPIVGTILGVLILAFGIYKKNQSVINTALVTFVAMAVLTVPVFLSGEEAEEVVEHMPGVSENIIEEHEELAEVAIWFMGLLGVMALAGLLADMKKLPFVKTLIMATFVFSIITFGVFAKVGNLGGKIRHPEIRNETTAPGQNTEEKTNRYDDDDDDDD